MFECCLRRFVSHDAVWLTKVMLSRARRIEEIMSLGLPAREVLEAGPPNELVRSFSKLFDERLASTIESVKEARAYLGW